MKKILLTLALVSCGQKGNTKNSETEQSRASYPTFGASHPNQVSNNFLHNRTEELNKLFNSVKAGKKEAFEKELTSIISKDPTFNIEQGNNSSLLQNIIDEINPNDTTIEMVKFMLESKSDILNTKRFSDNYNELDSLFQKLYSEKDESAKTYYRHLIKIVLNKLSSYISNKNKYKKHGYEPLMQLAIEHNDAKMVNLLFKKNQETLHLENSKEETPLSYAFDNRKPLAVFEILELLSEEKIEYAEEVTVKFITNISNYIHAKMTKYIEEFGNDISKIEHKVDLESKAIVYRIKLFLTNVLEDNSDHKMKGTLENCGKLFSSCVSEHSKKFLDHYKELHKEHRDSNFKNNDVKDIKKVYANWTNKGTSTQSTSNETQKNTNLGATQSTQPANINVTTTQPNQAAPTQSTQPANINVTATQPNQAASVQSTQPANINVTATQPNQAASVQSTQPAAKPVTLAQQVPVSATPIDPKITAGLALPAPLTSSLTIVRSEEGQETSNTEELGIVSESTRSLTDFWNLLESKEKELSNSITSRFKSFVGGSKYKKSEELKLKKDLDELYELIEKLESKQNIFIGEHQLESEENKAKDKENKKLILTLKKANEYKNKLESELNKIQEKLAKVIEKDTKAILELQSKNSKYENELKALKDTHKLDGETLSDLQSKLSTSLAAEIQDSKKKDKLEEKIKNLETDLSVSQNASTTNAQRLSDAQNKLDMIKTQLNESKTKLEVENKQLEGNNQTINSLKTQLEESKKATISAKEAVDKNSKEIASLSNRFNAIQESLDKITSKISQPNNSLTTSIVTPNPVIASEPTTIGTSETGQDIIEDETQN